MADICVIGTGYVGLVTGACLADMGNHVMCVDIDIEKINQLRQGTIPIYEPGLEQMVQRNKYAKRLGFTASYTEGLANAEFVFMAVNTPASLDQGKADMRYVKRAAQMIGETL